MKRCHFWLGRFNDMAEVDDYFEEIVPYPNDAPISQFASDQGKIFYDHDLVFAEFHESADLGAILESISAPAETRDAVLAAASKLDFKCNLIVGADEGEFQDPVSVAGPPQLRYIGCHALWGDARDAEPDAATDRDGM
jgi:hypothetical protein